MSAINRLWYAEGQLSTVAPDAATAQAQMEAALASISASLGTLNNSSSFSVEKENGQIVMEEPG